MSEEQKKTLRKIRTFAQDAAIAQGKDGNNTTSTDTLVSVPVSVPTEKAAAAKVFATQTPTKSRPGNQESTPLAKAPHIPASHELQKKTTVPNIKSATAHTTPPIPTIHVEPSKKVTVRAKKRDLKEKVSASGGTIITDTKRNKTNFFDALIISINDWFSAFSKKLTPKETPTYTVTDVERRKGVVQKATSKTGTIFTADQETLKDEIRRRNQTPVQTHTEPDISWSPNVEPGYALLETQTASATEKVPEPLAAKKPERIQVEFKRNSLPAPVFTQPSAPEVVLIPTSPAVTLPIPVQEYKVPEVTPLQQAAPTPPPQPTTIESVVVEEPLQEVSLEQTDSQETKLGVIDRLVETIRFNTNALTLSIAGVALTLLILVVIARTLVNSLIPDAASIATIPPATSLLASTTVTDVTLPTLSQATLAEQLKATETISNTPKEIRLVDASGTPLSKETTLELLGFSGSKNFVQTVSIVHVVTINAQHAIVLKITDPTAAFGTLLTWEPNMAEGLQQFLGTTNPTSQTNFSDETIGNSDVRVLTSDGKELIVYGFLSADTVLITEDINSFKNILGSK